MLVDFNGDGFLGDDEDDDDLGFEHRHLLRASWATERRSAESEVDEVVVILLLLYAAVAAATAEVVGEGVVPEQQFLPFGRRWRWTT